MLQSIGTWECPGKWLDFRRETYVDSNSRKSSSARLTSIEDSVTFFSSRRIAWTPLPESTWAPEYRRLHLASTAASPGSVATLMVWPLHVTPETASNRCKHGRSESTNITKVIQTINLNPPRVGTRKCEDKSNGSRGK